MRHEGLSRQHVRKWNRFVDLENYGLLESEFRGEKTNS
jgi:RimJ/RimL family protein N-acetyltransferase